MSTWNGDSGGRFSRGWQPCSYYSPRDDGFGGNEHDCYCVKNGSSCDGKVSWCESCHTDHHAGGYESCGGCGASWALMSKDAKQ